MILRTTEPPTEYHAHFWHHKRRGRMVTEVLFHEGACEVDERDGLRRCIKPARHAEARCSKLDIFQKRVGRIIALTRLFHQHRGGAVLLNREMRKQLWESYFAQSKKPLSGAHTQGKMTAPGPLGRY